MAGWGVSPDMKIAVGVGVAGRGVSPDMKIAVFPVSACLDLGGGVVGRGVSPDMKSCVPCFSLPGPGWGCGGKGCVPGLHCSCSKEHTADLFSSSVAELRKKVTHPFISLPVPGNAVLLARGFFPIRDFSRFFRAKRGWEPGEGGGEGCAPFVTC